VRLPDDSEEEDQRPAGLEDQSMDDLSSSGRSSASSSDGSQSGVSDIEMNTDAPPDSGMYQFCIISPG
jgi:hypothetical protein